MNELALFAGAGGGILGGKLLGWRTVCAVEIDPYCRAVLAQRQNDGALEAFPIWDDVRTFDGREWSGRVDVVSAGFPCQPFSVAGKKQADGDARNMWPDTIRVIREVRPRFAFLENVPGLLSAKDQEGRKYFGRVLGDLAEAGYDAEWTVLGADDCGAPHRRKRLWILAHADGTGHKEYGGNEPVQPKQSAAKRGGDDVADATRGGFAVGGGTSRSARYADECGQGMADTARDVEGRAQQRAERQRIGAGGKSTWWDIDPAEMGDAIGQRQPGQGQPLDSGDCAATGEGQADHAINERIESFGLAESRLGRVAHGVAARVDRLKAIGNGQVPIVAAAAWAELFNRINNETGGLSYE